MTDAQHMHRALELAASTGSVSPRPPVGAVVVDPDGRVVGEGATTPSPGPHAEVLAIERAGEAAAGATLYVTLEPCCHTGATPPCTDAIIEAGISRVVAALGDPDPRVDGRGLAILRRAGIRVRTGTAAAEAARVVEPFTKWVKTARPFVTLKIAATMDGKVAAPDSTSRWITGEQARAEVHTLRSVADAVCVGAGTVAADDPALTCRLPGFAGRQPTRVVLDSSGRTPAGARVFDGAAPVLVCTTADCPPGVRGAWQAAGAEVLVCPSAEGGVDLSAALDGLAERGICHVLAEPGPRLSASLVAGGLADRLVLYVAPKLLGGEAPGLLAGGVKTLSEAWELALEEVARVGDDLRVTARPRRRG